MAHEPMIYFHLKLVAKISLAVGAAAVLVLLAALTLITGDTGESYGAIIRSQSLTRQQLGPAMLVGGLLLVAVAGFITWLIALYTSFRVAGPLYRLAENLKLARASNSIELIGLRKGDALFKQADGINHAVSNLRQHYGDLKIAADAASSALVAGDAARYADATARLKELDEKVRV